MGKNQTVSPKIVALVFGILVISFAVAFYVVAWTEPGQAPPGGNVSAPLNTGSIGQSKSGGLILNTAGANNGLIIAQGNLCLGTDCRSVWPAAGTNYWTPSGNNIYNNNTGNVGIGIMNPANKLEVEGNLKTTGFQMTTGAVAGKVLTSDASGIGTWQTAAPGIPAGMIAMFDANCPSGWTRFAALDGRVARGSSAYGGIGGSDNHLHGIGTVCGGSFVCASPGSPEETGPASSWPPYLNVIWCKKD